MRFFPVMRLMPVLAALMLPCTAHAFTSPIIVSDAWTRALPVQDGAAVVYLSITDIGDADTLIKVHTPAAANASLQRNAVEDGVTSLQQVDSLPVTSDQPVDLSQNGCYIMLTGMQMRLTAGKRFPMTLVFQKAGNVDIMVEVRKADYVDPLTQMK